MNLLKNDKISSKYLIKSLKEINLCRQQFYLGLEEFMVQILANCPLAYPFTVIGLSTHISALFSLVLSPTT